MQSPGGKANGLEDVSVAEKGLASSPAQPQQSQQQKQPHGTEPILIQAPIITNPDSALPVPEKITTTTSHTRQISDNPTATSTSLPSQLITFITRKSGTGKPLDVEEPPDGGIQAWTVVLLCHLIGFHAWGFLNAFGVLQSYYVISLSRSPSDISWIGSLQAFFMFFLSFISGRLMDAGYFHQLFFVGSTLQILGFFFASIASTYWQVLLCHSLCIGLGGGIHFIPSISLVATYFRRKRAPALALVVCGNSAGGLFYAAVLQNALPAVGYAWTMRICGFIMLVTLVPANWLLKPRRIKRSTGPLVEWSAFVEPAYGMFTLGMFMSMVGMWIPVFYLGSFGRDIIHLSPKDSANLLLIINGVGLAGRLVPAALSPIYGPINLIVILTLSSAIILFTWLSVHTQRSAIIFDIFYGMFMSAAQGMLPPSLGSMTHDLSKMGVRLGMVFSVLGFSLLIGNPFAGWLIQRMDGQYVYAQVYAGGTMLVGALFLAVARYHVTGLKVFVKV